MTTKSRSKLPTIGFAFAGFWAFAALVFWIAAR
jgi:fatty acid desaturase